MGDTRFIPVYAVAQWRGVSTRPFCRLGARYSHHHIARMAMRVYPNLTCLLRVTPRPGFEWRGEHIVRSR